MLTELYDTFWFLLNIVQYMKFHIEYVIYIYFTFILLIIKIQKRFFSYEKESFSNFIHPITYGK